MLLKAGMYGHYLEATISLKFQRRKFQNHIKGIPSSLDILLYFLVFELLITKITTKVLCGVSGWQKSALKFLIFRHFENGRRHLEFPTTSRDSWSVAE